MKIVHQDALRSFVYLGDDEKEIGRIDYKVGTKGRVFAVHTEIVPAYQGQGLATHLLDALVAWAKDTGQTIVPVCSFSKKMFDTHPDLYKEVRA